MNAAKEGTRALYGPKFGPVGCIETLEAARQSEHYSTPLGPNQGRGIATGFWFNIGGESCATINVNEDGTATVIEGNPDIGGSRASIQLQAAEALGIPPERVRPLVADTDSIGYTFLTGGSRVTFATGMAAIERRGRSSCSCASVPRRSGTFRSTRWSGRTATPSPRAATPATSSP